MNLDYNKLEKGKVYFIDYDGVCQLIARYHSKDTTKLYLDSEIKIYNCKSVFKEEEYCVKSGITELRAATKEETAKLVKCEAENDVQYKEKDTKRQEFFNFLSQEHGLDLTETEMEDIIHEVQKLQPEPTATPLTAESLPDDFKQGGEFNYLYEKKINPRLWLGFNSSSKSAYLATEDRNTPKVWFDITEEKLQEIHKIFTGKEIEFKDLELEETVNLGLVKEIEILNKVVKDQREEIDRLQEAIDGYEMVIESSEQLKSTIETQALLFAKTTNTKNHLKERLDKQILKGQAEYKTARVRLSSERVKMREYLVGSRDRHEEDSEFYNIFQVCLNELERITKEDA
jgi:hypothetical protein